MKTNVKRLIDDLMVAADTADWPHDLPCQCAECNLITNTKRLVSDWRRATNQIPAAPPPADFPSPSNEF